MTVKKKKKAKGKGAAAKKVQAPSNHLSVPQMFFQRLEARLAALGLNRADMDTKTDLENHPPCFALRETSYEAWLAAAMNAEPPLRLDMPAEVNYCHDCTASFRKTAKKAALCLFPHMRLEKRNEFGEQVMVGVTHSRFVTAREFLVDRDLAPAAVEW